MKKLINGILHMFRKTKIDENTSLVPMSRDSFRYKEGDRAIDISVELMSGETSRIIYSSSIQQWLPPHDKDLISDEKKREILQKVCENFDANGYSYTVQ